MVKETQARFPELSSCSLDQGFHSTAHQRDWAKLRDPVILPKKGRLSTAQQARQQADELVAGRRQHAAIESAIHALEVHSLDRCPDRGLPALRRDGALAVVARNIQLVGRYLQCQDPQVESEPYRKAA